MLFGRFHNALVNYGITDEEYSKIRLNIVETNQKNLTMGCYICGVYMIGMLFVSLLMGSEVPHWLYAIGAAISVITVILNRVLKKHTHALKWLIYVVLLDILGMGILMGTLYGPTLPAVAFPCFLIIAPLIFSDRPYRICASIVLVCGVFIFAACYTKEGVVLVTDVSNALIFGSVSFILSIYLGRVKIDRFVKEQQVYELANFDLLTGLQNRNCYIKNLDAIVEGTKKGIWCLYIDADNLHDVNNRLGHDAGDVMLKSVADALLRHLDLKNCYRMGGDEFICLISDFDDVEMSCITENIRDDVQKEGYHISMGIRKSPKEDLDLKTLIHDAETAMYEEKKKYYESMGMDMRNH